MIWLKRFAFLIAVYFVGLGFLAIIAAAVMFVTRFLLGITNPMFRQVEFGVCLVAAFGAAFFVLRRAWPTQSPRLPETPENSNTSAAASNT